MLDLNQLTQQLKELDSARKKAAEDRRVAAAELASVKEYIKAAWDQAYKEAQQEHSNIVKEASALQIKVLDRNEQLDKREKALERKERTILNQIDKEVERGIDDMFSVVTSDVEGKYIEARQQLEAWAEQLSKRQDNQIGRAHV